MWWSTEALHWLKHKRNQYIKIARTCKTSCSSKHCCITLIDPWSTADFDWFWKCHRHLNTSWVVDQSLSICIDAPTISQKMAIAEDRLSYPVRNRNFLSKKKAFSIDILKPNFHVLNSINWNLGSLRINELTAYLKLLLKAKQGSWKYRCISSRINQNAKLLFTGTRIWNCSNFTRIHRHHNHSSCHQYDVTAQTSPGKLWGLKSRMSKISSPCYSTSSLTSWVLETLCCVAAAGCWAPYVKQLKLLPMKTWDIPGPLSKLLSHLSPNDEPELIASSLGLSALHSHTHTQSKFWEDRSGTDSWGWGWTPTLNNGAGPGGRNGLLGTMLWRDKSPFILHGKGCAVRLQLTTSFWQVYIIAHCVCTQPAKKLYLDTSASRIR